MNFEDSCSGGINHNNITIDKAFFLFSIQGEDSICRPNNMQKTTNRCIMHLPPEKLNNCHLPLPQSFSYLVPNFCIWMGREAY
ncbi:hypothetical protein EUGRSUZ_D01079 [Eucalyptus grandis]|uniref:Uncharacterized protein n=2 Tax=Eucalyptus grandis TaxID=71139 RepID=A0ACC3L509_EUCGR|nr:hypothetical protein EUGRSUZ_D01079 [Eucalyptus grandis]